MTKVSAKQGAIRLRKEPRQERSNETVSIIVEAAARILERKGFEGFNTNAIAEHAGVSIGSLYQYFPSKHALLSALIQREMHPLLALEEELRTVVNFQVALDLYVSASVQNQMRRPELARMIDVAERQELFDEQVLKVVKRLTASMSSVLSLPGAPPLKWPGVAAADSIAIIKALTDAAGERGERNVMALRARILAAVGGYLFACESA